MDDLIAFLRAQLDRRADVIAKAGPAAIGWVARYNDEGFLLESVLVERLDTEWTLNGEPVDDPTKVKVFFDPMTELADVAAKRQIIALVLDENNGVIAADRSIECEWGCTSDLHEQLLKLLALPFAGHPDYREEWKP